MYLDRSFDDGKLVSVYPQDVIESRCLDCCLHDFRKGGAGQMKMREVAERFRHMLKVKDCRHLCLTCEYYEICKREVNADEYEIRNEK